MVDIATISMVDLPMVTMVDLPCHGDHGQGGKMVKMTKIQPVCRLTSDLLTEHSPHPSYHAARIHTERKNDQHLSLGDCWKLFLLFHVSVPFYDIFDKSNCFN